jgi:peptide subunit release factor RF-3
VNKTVSENRHFHRVTSRFLKGFDTACKLSRLYQARRYHLAKTKQKDLMPLTPETQQTIKQELGEEALKVILENDAQTLFIADYELLLFTVKRNDCEYLLGSDPTYIYMGDEDKEFTCFEDLLNEINQLSPIPQ